MKIKSFWLCFLILIAMLFSSFDDGVSIQQSQSTITVFGNGVVLAQPDMIQISIMLSKVTKTNKLAQEEVSKMVSQALAILKNANIENKDIKTASLTFRPEYEYTNRRVLIGQRAEQRIIFSVDGIGNDNEKVPGIIDQLIQINGLDLEQINFGVKDNSEYYVKSRELAFNQAVKKASQYAELSNLKIIKVLSVSEDGPQQISPLRNEAVKTASMDVSTVLPMGELEITSRILVVFLLE